MSASIEPLFSKKKWKRRTLSLSIQEKIKSLSLLLTQNTVLNNDSVNNIVSDQNHKAIFYGAKGTGKKQAASLLAQWAQKEVYRIDLSRLISKYIGETEKNLDLLFAKAAEKDWILFFDEADALFGKRADVRDAHDRYANLEISFLLQRLESYKGLVILSGDNKHLDNEILHRRFQTVVRFPGKKKTFLNAK